MGNWSCVLSWRVPRRLGGPVISYRGYPFAGLRVCGGVTLAGAGGQWTDGSEICPNRA